MALFNLFLEKVVRDSRIDGLKNTQLIGYADDINITGSTLIDVKDTFLNLKKQREKNSFKNK